jgi:uncharacterized membrane protein
MATVNPFDPTTILFAKHAQHVVLVHFPIGLFTGVARQVTERVIWSLPLTTTCWWQRSSLCRWW